MKNQKAQFEGVLVPLPHYRQYSEAIELSEFYQEQNQKLIQDAKSVGPLESGLIGFSIGVLAGIWVKR